MRSVLIVCTGNSCRSVMAEALVNHLGEGRLKAESAGSNPAGFVHPKSLETLQRHGIAPNDPRSKSWDEFADQTFDTVITVCDQAAGESCPIFLGQCEKLHWSISDPAKAEGSEEDIDRAFDDAFRVLKARIEKELL
jgi:arsenate reductase